jgi:hypothetical protein
MAALLSFGGCWLWALVRGIPIPYVHDESSYLLAADTFAHGHVTNPTHPMWAHFETFTELQRPTYMSIYPPAQGAFLALGKVIFGLPIYGVWLSSALMCAAICWMLYAWVSPRWALVGGLVAVLQFGVFTYWNQGYYGGAVAAMGGALVFGALPRIFKTRRIRDALWLGLGCAVMANSRPLEGFLVAIPVGCLVLPWKIRWKEVVLARFIKRVILPLCIVLLITILGIGAYNKRVTGDAGTFPHFLYTDTYSSVPAFIFEPLRPPVHFNNITFDRHEENWVKRHYFYKRTWKGFLDRLQFDNFWLLAFFFGFPLAMPSLAVFPLFFRCRRKSIRFILAILILIGAGSSTHYLMQVHYMAALTCLAVLMITIGLKWLAGLRLRNQRVGLVLVIILIIFQFFLNIMLTPNLPVVRSLARNLQSSGINLPASFTREELTEALIKQGGQYLVVVHYPISHNYLFEWVYNEADIDHAPIVWARDLDEGQNKKLLEYFKNRRVLHIMVYWDMRTAPNVRARQ